MDALRSNTARSADVDLAINLVVLSEWSAIVMWPLRFDASIVLGINAVDVETIFRVEEPKKDPKIDEEDDNADQQHVRRSQMEGQDVLESGMQAKKMACACC